MHDGEVFLCSLCPQKYYSEGRLAKHVREDHEMKNACVCSSCGKTLKNKVWAIKNSTVAPKITPRWYKLLPSATLAQDASVDQNKTLSNSCSLISFKTIKILSNFALTIANWSISRSRNLENIRKIKITCFREVQGHKDFSYINCITFRHFSIQYLSPYSCIFTL